MMHYAAPLLMPIAIALLLVMLLAPAVSRIERIGVPRILAVGTAILAVLVAVSGLAWVVTQQANQLLDAFPQYEDNLRKKLAVLRTDEGTLLTKLRDIARRVDREISGNDVTTVPLQDQAVKVTVVGPESELSLSNLPTIASAAAPALGGAVLCIALLAFMLLRREDLRERIFGLAGRSRMPMTTRAMDEAWERISRTLLVQFTVNSSFGVLFGTGLYFIGIPFAPLWGLLAIALRYVPFVGSTLALALPLAVSVLMMQGWQGPMLVVALFGVLVLVVMGVEAWFVGPGIGVSPTATLLMLAFWTWLWGPVALVLAMPLTACFMVAARFLPHFRFVEIAFGNRPALQAPERLYQRLLSQDVDESTRLVGDHVAEHGFVPACDRLLVPALMNGVVDYAARRISDEEYDRVIDTSTLMLEDVEAALRRVPTQQGEREAHAGGAAPLRVFCLSRSDLDHLGHTMLRIATRNDNVEVDIGSPGLLMSEAIARMLHERADVVCIGDSPHGGLPAAKLACRRLRRHFPVTPIVVVRWGGEDQARREATILRSVGATAVHGSVDAARLALVALCAGRRQASDAVSLPQAGNLIV
jgi:predicted PurR-regulated permease PerM